MVIIPPTGGIPLWSSTYMRTIFWRWLSAMLLLAVPTNAFALDLTPQPDRLLTDPANLPMAGQLLGSTAGTYGSGSAMSTTRSAR